MTDLSIICHEAEQCLHSNILPYWLRLRDTKHGGYYGQVTGNETVVPTADRSAVLYARLLWTFSACQLPQEAQEVKDYILAHFIDSQYGGTYWAVDYQGHAIDTKKQFYAQAFMLYAFSEHARIFADDDSLQTAVRFYRLLEQHARDYQHGGYYEAATRDWNTLDDVRLSEKDENAVKSQNTHLHILEAYTNLYRVWQDQQLKNDIQDLIHIFTHHIILPSGHLGLFFDAMWHVSTLRTSYGHDIECSWLLDEAAQLTQCNADNAVQRLSDIPFPSHNLFLDWWEPAEAIVGYLNRYRHFHDETALIRLTDAWNYIQQHLIDREHGEWYWSAMHDPKQDKAGFWKCPYHNARMCLEIIKRIKNIQL